MGEFFWIELNNILKLDITELYILEYYDNIIDMIFNIRLASKKDLPQLITFGRMLHDVEAQYEPLLKFSDTEAEHRYERELNNPHALLAIAEFEGKPVGYMYAHYELIEYLDKDQPECEIEVIFITEHYRRKGLSKQFIQYCKEWALANNIFRLKVGIYSQNENSIASFKHFGFKPYHYTYTYSL